MSGALAGRRLGLRPWHYKLALDTSKALIPFHSQVRALWRLLSPYHTDPSNDAGLMNDAIELAGLEAPAGKRVLEFGSGWNPVLPLIFRLAGATRVTLTDQERLLDRALLLAAVAAVRSEWPRIRSELGLSEAAVELLDVDPSAPLHDLLAALGLDYVVPFECGALAPGSIDLIVSRAVLEHVPARVLPAILADFRRLLSVDGRMLHQVDMSDHWEHKDKSISRVNFLRYGDVVWRLTQINPQNVQNRLRRCDYVELFANAGFQEISATGEPHAASLAALRGLPLAPRFRGTPLEELAIVDTRVSARV